MLKAFMTKKLSQISTLTAVTVTIGAAIGMALPTPSMANQTTFNTMIGKVKEVEILTSTYIRKTPVEEKVCSVKCYCRALKS